MRIDVTIPMACVPHPRPRFGGRAWMPRKYMKWKEDCCMYLELAYDGAPLLGKVEVEIDLVFTRPVRLLKMSSPSCRLPKTGRADLDNMLKSVLDVCQDGGLVKNDNQVWCLTGRQWHQSKDEEDGPQIRIRMKELE